MDASRFDALTRMLSGGNTRRRLLGAIAAAPALGGMLGILPLEETEGKSRQARRKRGRHDRDFGAEKKQKMNKKKNKNKAEKKNPGCTSESTAQTCAGRCGQVPNNCDVVVDCGSCACSAACPACQTCDSATGRCVTNPAFIAQACGFPGQVCRADGVCACDDDSCTDGLRCNGIACVCDATSCPNGCCDGNRACRVNEDAACGTGGGICTHCPECQACICGTCASDVRQNRTTCQLPGGGGRGACCNGVCCAGCCDARAEQGACSPCLAFVTSTTSNGNLGGLVGADRMCQARAEAGGFWGSYKAWLSSTVDSPSSRFRCTAASCSSRGYQRVDGITIASDWVDLTTCDPTSGDCLAVPLVLSEFNQPVTSNPTWSNTRMDGAPVGAANVNCQNWTVGTNSSIGRVGLSEVKDADWTDGPPDSCFRVNSLYCFQQD